MANIDETPLMKQYAEMKRKHPDAVLLFRVGDFYETFCDDAVTASEILGITLTRRANGKAASIALAGFPHHALDTYLPKLVRAGKRVAICDQLEDPKLTKKLVKRGITELVTPGVITNTSAIDEKEPVFLAAIHVEGPRAVGVAFVDITTGDFFCTEGSAAEIDKLISTMAPKELLRMHGLRDFCDKHFSHKCSVYELDDWVYTKETAEEKLLSRFSTASLKGFGVDDMHYAVIAAGSILVYLEMTGHTNLSHITTLRRIDESAYVRLDRFTMRNLELIEPLAKDGKSLLSVIDRTTTPMGSRMLRWWLAFPEISLDEINRRLDVNEFFFSNREFRDQVFGILNHMGDMERLAGRLGNWKITPREMWQLGEALMRSSALKKLLASSGHKQLSALADRIPHLEETATMIADTIVQPQSGVGRNDYIIAAGVDPRLDELKNLSDNSTQALQAIQQREIEATGISSLKIGFNNVFGYYLEVRNTHKDKVPPTWIRRQTLTSAERYITEELKEYEGKILGAKEKIQEMEDRIFKELVGSLLPRLGDIHAATKTVARVDCLRGLADVASDCNYVRPEVDDSTSIDIRNGRHPVIERNLPPGESYVANSLTLDCDHQQIMMLTGPNMSGKSAFLRQTALIVLLAQIGSFVPAEKARIGYVDKIFTRVGASDNISSGESTFMVEMNEAASILNNMSQRSLILFDELGRGTSTYDGISIAWAIVEHIHENGKMRPKTLFATHYHELNEMESNFKRIVNYNVSVKEIGGKVVFMRKLERGGSAHSFGIHVAKLAGMPPSIVKRAGQVLEQLEAAAKSVDTEEGATATVAAKGAMKDMGRSRDGYQLSLFQLDDPLLSQMRDALLNISIDNLTPLQALNKLHELQSLLTGKD